MVSVQNLSLSLDDKPILKDISFELGDKNNLVILGRSGSGKTVLSKTLMGFFPPQQGRVIIDHVDIYQNSSHTSESDKSQFAIVFQNAALLDSLSVFQNVALPLYTRGEKDLEKVKEKVRQALCEVGLEDEGDKFPAQLSGGMRKRVGIARALVYEPRYIVFDEPVSGLDPITANEVLYYINRIVESETATTITITHDVRNLERVGDMVLFLEAGEALYYGSLDDLSQTTSPLIRDFFGFGPLEK